MKNEDDKGPTFEEAYEAGYRNGHADATAGFGPHERKRTFIHKVEIKVGGDTGDPSKIAREVMKVLKEEAKKSKK